LINLFPPSSASTEIFMVLFWPLINKDNIGIKWGYRNSMNPLMVCTFQLIKKAQILRLFGDSLTRIWGQPLCDVVNNIGYLNSGELRISINKDKPFTIKVRLKFKIDLTNY